MSVGFDSVCTMSFKLILMVERTSMSLLVRSSECEIGVGTCRLGKTESKQTKDPLEKSFRAQERVTLLRELLDQLLILVQPICQVGPRKRKHLKNKLVHRWGYP